MRNLFISAIFLVLMLPVAGAVQAQELSVTIGVSAPLTGAQANVGDDMVKGAQLAVDQARGIKVKLDIEDDACDPQTGVNAANKMVANRDQIVTGYYCSGAAVPSTAVLHRAHIPTIIAAAINPSIMQQGFPEMFRIMATTLQEAPVATKVLNQIYQAKTVVILHDNSAVTKTEADTIAADFTAHGGKVLLESGVAPGTTEFGVTVARIVSLNPDAVVQALYYTESALMAKQLDAAGYPGKMLILVGGVNPGFIKIAGDKLAEKYIYLSQPVTSQIPKAKAFIEAYKAKYGAGPGPISVYVYDAVNIAIAVVKQANSTDPDKVIAALRAYRGEGTTGPIQFDSSGQLAGEGGFPPLIVRNGQFILRQ